MTNLPGLPTIAALMLAAVLAAWASVGPFNLGPLKDWQPLIAAILALGGGTLVYRGAMEKVRLDREIFVSDTKRRVLALSLKLQFAIHRLRDEIAVSLHAREQFRPSSEKDDVEILLDVSTPPELEEAWHNLDIFPRQLAIKLGDLRSQLALIQQAKAELKSPKLPWVVQLLREIVRTSNSSLPDLEQLIRENAPPR